MCSGVKSLPTTSWMDYAQSVLTGSGTSEVVRYDSVSNLVVNNAYDATKQFSLNMHDILIPYLCPLTSPNVIIVINIFWLAYCSI